MTIEEMIGMARQRDVSELQSRLFYEIENKVIFL